MGVNSPGGGDKIYDLPPPLLTEAEEATQEALTELFCKDGFSRFEEADSLHRACVRADGETKQFVRIMWIQDRFECAVIKIDEEELRRIVQSSGQFVLGKMIAIGLMGNYYPIERAPKKN